MICTAANALWVAGCLNEAARFRRGMKHVREQQAAVLRRLLRANRDTEFGRRHGFGTIASMREYQARVPIRSYDEYERAITRIGEGAQDVLTRDPVRLFEPTSGSASATKLVPYTRSLQREFQRGVAAWIADLFTHDPGLMRGQAYWSVSPVTCTAARTPSRIPIGFDDDSAYVGGWRRRLVQAVLAAPPALRRAADMETFRYRTLLALVRSGNLRLISIWNPSFLSLILGALPACADRLIADLHDVPERARVLRRALQMPTPAECHAVLWPRLRLISCWADANAKAPARELAACFPQARVQPKGLLSTEGFVSLPLSGREGGALAIRSHFLEFAPLGSDGSADERSAVPAHELEAGWRYTVILSTGGGLYRYRLNDVVDVIGRAAECPLIAFAGKHEYVSDWCGEKLHEAHVASVLREAFALAGSPLAPRFALLACDRELAPPAYVLYVDSGAEDASLMKVAATVEQKLRANFHYDYARLLGQLGPVGVFRAADAAQVYLATGVRAGQRAGDVKPLALDRRDGWSERFRGAFIPMPSRSTPFGFAPGRLAR